MLVNHHGIFEFPSNLEHMHIIDMARLLSCSAAVYFLSGINTKHTGHQVVTEGQENIVDFDSYDLLHLQYLAIS